MAGGVKGREPWWFHGVPGGVVTVPVCGIGDMAKARTGGRAYDGLVEGKVERVVHGLGYEDWGV